MLLFLIFPIYYVLKKCQLLLNFSKAFLIIILLKNLNFLPHSSFSLILNSIFIETKIIFLTKLLLFIYFYAQSSSILSCMVKSILKLLLFFSLNSLNPLDQPMVISAFKLNNIGNVLTKCKLSF